MVAENRRVGPAGEAWHRDGVAAVEDYGAVVRCWVGLARRVLVFFFADEALASVEREGFDVDVRKMDDGVHVSERPCYLHAWAL